MHVVTNFIDPIVKEAIRIKRERQNLHFKEVKDSDEQTLLDNLVDSTEDPITLRDEIMSLLVAGRDTVGNYLRVN